MQARNNFNRENVYKEGGAIEQLPVDRAYVCQIKNAKEVTNEYGSKLVVAFEIIEGEYSGYYGKRFAQDKENNEDAKWKGVVRISVPVDKPESEMTDQEKWAVKGFNTNIVAIEDSNDGYSWDWDEKKLADKFVGLVLRNKEYDFDGRHGWYSEPYKFISVENARAGKFRKPKDKTLNNSSSTGFVSANTADADEIPFI